MNMNERTYGGNACSAGDAGTSGAQSTGGSSKSRNAAIDGLAEKRTLRGLLVLLCQAPLCVCLAATVILIQWADFMRSQAVADDALSPALAQYMHPAALAFLIAGYALSVAVTVASAWIALRPGCDTGGCDGNKYDAS